MHCEGKFHFSADAVSRVPSRSCPRVECPNCYPDVEEINWMTLQGLHESICTECQFHNEWFSGHEAEIQIHAFGIDGASRNVPPLGGANFPSPGGVNPPSASGEVCQKSNGRLTLKNCKWSRTMILISCGLRVTEPLLKWQSPLWMPLLVIPKM